MKYQSLVILYILNLLDGCKYKIFNISCYIVNFVFTPTHLIQNLKYDSLKKLTTHVQTMQTACYAKYV